MKVLTTIKEMSEEADRLRKSGKKIGFVPTMGALHEGHISLVNRAVKENDVTVVSIFVNPIQFNNPEDLKNYPRDIEKDLTLLKKNNCDLVFCPDEKEIYPEKISEKYDLGGLDRLMEGQFRPGHFQGVVVVVKRFFDIIRPDSAYFGKKDFQQLSIIKYIVQQLNIPVNIIGCETVREEDGLAKSSRNQLLSSEMRREAPFISQTLFKCRELKANMDVDQVKKYVHIAFNQSSKLNLEYFEIIGEENLLPVNQWNDKKNTVACIAVWAGNVRLIDNIYL
jgi:pantoate--beta-alanine ligase